MRSEPSRATDVVPGPADPSARGLSAVPETRGPRAASPAAPITVPGLSSNSHGRPPCSTVRPAGTSPRVSHSRRRRCGRPHHQAVPGTRLRPGPQPWPMPSTPPAPSTVAAGERARRRSSRCARTLGAPLLQRLPGGPSTSTSATWAEQSVRRERGSRFLPTTHRRPPAPPDRASPEGTPLTTADVSRGTRLLVEPARTARRARRADVEPLPRIHVGLQASEALPGIPPGQSALRAAVFHVKHRRSCDLPATDRLLPVPRSAHHVPPGAPILRGPTALRRRAVRHRPRQAGWITT